MLNWSSWFACFTLYLQCTVVATGWTWEDMSSCTPHFGMIDIERQQFFLFITLLTFFSILSVFFMCCWNKVKWKIFPLNVQIIKIVHQKHRTHDFEAEFQKEIWGGAQPQYGKGNFLPTSTPLGVCSSLALHRHRCPQARATCPSRNNVKARFFVSVSCGERHVPPSGSQCWGCLTG